MSRSLRRAPALVAVLLSGSGLLSACSGGQAARSARSTTTVPAPTTSAEAPASTEPVSTEATGPVPSAGTPRSGTPAPTTRPATAIPPTVAPLPSGDVRIRDTEVGSVDRAAGSFTLAERPGGYAVVVVTGSTVFTLAEGDPASFADVEPGTSVAVTGTASAPDRLVARRVVVLG